MDVEEKGPSKLVINGALFGIQLIFCGWVILAKVSVSGGFSVQPIVFCFYREVISALIMLAIAWHSDGILVPDMKDVPRIVLLGSCTFLCIFGYLTALEYTSAADAALLSPLQPVMAIILGSLIGLEQLSLMRAGGVLTCALGSMTVTVFSGAEDVGSAPEPILGMLILLGCALCAAVLFLAQKKLLMVYPSTTVTAWYYCAAGVMTAFVASREAITNPDAFMQPFRNNIVIVALLYAVIFATVVNYEVLSWANKHTAASTVMSYSAVQPIGTTFLSYFTLHTEVYPAQVFGGITILIGLFLVVLAPSNEEHDGDGEATSVKEMDPVSSTGFTPRCIRFGDRGATDLSSAESADPQSEVTESDSLLQRSPKEGSGEDGDLESP